MRRPTPLSSFTHRDRRFAAVESALENSPLGAAGGLSTSAVGSFYTTGGQAANGTQNPSANARIAVFMSVDPTIATEPSATLAVALVRHGVALDDDKTARLDHYCRLLWDWNDKLNLTRHTTYDKFVARDVLDSLALGRQLAPDEDVLDLGSGGGVPGIVLAILRPDISVSLSDSVGKKAKVLAQIVQELGLDLPVHHAPGQTLLEEGLYDTIVTRAVASLTKLLTWVEPHWHFFHRLLVIKGPAWVAERQEARRRGLFQELQLRRVEEYLLPGADHPSVVLEIKPREDASAAENE